MRKTLRVRAGIPAVTSSAVSSLVSTYYSWDVLHKLEKQAAQVRWIGHGSRAKDGSIAWTYSCDTLSSSNPGWKVTCQERPSKHQYAGLGYTVTIEDAAATSDFSSRLFLM